jgi:hypothetical protein
MNNPIRFIDPDGMEPITFTVLAIKALIGAGVDIAAQMSIGMSLKNQNFSEAFSNIDWTSVGASAITGAVGLPGANTISKTAKVATIATTIAADASIDITASKGTETILTGEKSFGSAVIDATGSLLGTKASDGFLDGAKNAINKDIQSGTFSTLTSSEKNTLKQPNSIIDSEGAQTGVKTFTEIGVEGAEQTFKTLTVPAVINAPAFDKSYYPAADATMVVRPYYPTLQKK